MILPSTLPLPCQEVLLPYRYSSSSRPIPSGRSGLRFSALRELSLSTSQDKSGSKRTGRMTFFFFWLCLGDLMELGNPKTSSQQKAKKTTPRIHTRLQVNAKVNRPPWYPAVDQTPARGRITFSPREKNLLGQCPLMTDRGNGRKHDAAPPPDRLQRNWVQAPSSIANSA